MADCSKQDEQKIEFERKLEAKQKQIDGIDVNIGEVDIYKVSYEKRAEDNKAEIQERAKELVSSIDDLATEFNSKVDMKKEKDFQDLAKYCEESKKLKTTYEKQLSYFKQVFGSLPSDDYVVDQFLKYSIPKLDAMAITLKKDFPKPLKLVTKSSTEISNCFGKTEEDVYFSHTGAEKPKYRSELEWELRFKPEPNRSSIFSIQVRPDGKAWITTFNYRIYLVLRTGKILDECMVSFLPIYTTVNKYGDLYCSSASSAIIRVTQDYDMTEFADLAPSKTHGLHVTKDEHMLVCVQDPKGSKIVKFSETGKLLQEITLDIDGEPVLKLPKFVTQNARSQICVADDKRLIVIDPSGKKCVQYRPEDDTWEGKSLIIDQFDNFISSECPLSLRPQNIHIMNASGEFVKTFKLEGPKISGVNALAIDYQYDEPVMWIGTPLGDVIIAKFVNKDI